MPNNMDYFLGGVLALVFTIAAVQVANEIYAGSSEWDAVCTNGQTEVEGVVSHYGTGSPSRQLVMTTPAGKTIAINAAKCVLTQR